MITVPHPNDVPPTKRTTDERSATGRAMPSTKPNILAMGTSRSAVREKAQRSPVAARMPSRKPPRRGESRPGPRKTVKLLAEPSPWRSQLVRTFSTTAFAPDRSWRAGDASDAERGRLGGLSDEHHDRVAPVATGCVGGQPRSRLVSAREAKPPMTEQSQNVTPIPLSTILLDARVMAGRAADGRERKGPGSPRQKIGSGRSQCATPCGGCR